MHSRQEQPQNSSDEEDDIEDDYLNDDDDDLSDGLTDDEDDDEMMMKHWILTMRITINSISDKVDWCRYHCGYFNYCCICDCKAGRRCFIWRKE